MEIGDPVLRAYAVTDRVFTIAGWFHPSSIRDQLLRACLLVDRMAPTIDGNDSIVIVGGGITGIAAACRAAQHNLRVKLFEKEATFVGRQVGCKTRHIDPFQYDWPNVLHSGIPHENLSLPLGSGIAHVLLTHWEYIFNLTRRTHSVQAEREAEVVDIITSSQPMRVVIRTPHGEAEEPATRIIVCTGFGEEVCSVPGSGFGGFRFWENDPFPAPDIGTHKKRPNILVSGGGDGALQDFIRIASGLISAKALYESLHGICSAYELDLFSVEDQAQRAYAWSREKAVDETANLDANVLGEIHRRFDSIIEQLFRDKSEQLRGWFLTIVAPRMAGLGRLRLVFETPYFTRSYALNRFLVMLLTRALSEFGESRHRDVLCPATRLLSVVSSTRNHECRFDPWDCLKFAHRVETVDSNGKKKADDFDVVVIRHGERRPPPESAPSWQRPPTFPRQLLPYFSPWPRRNVAIQ